MGRFDQYITGKIEVEIAGEKLELDARMEDKRKIKAAMNPKEGVSEKNLKIIDDTLIEILQRSYPAEKKEALIGFYERNDMEIVNKVLIAFGWLKQEELDIAKSELKNQMSL